MPPLPDDHKSQRLPGMLGGGSTSLFWLRNDPLLSEVVAAGLTPPEAAKVIGVSRNAVISRAYRRRLVWSNARPPRIKHQTLPYADWPPDGHCLWAVGDEPFCGKKCDGVYCEEHRVLSRLKGAKKQHEADPLR